MYIKEKKSVFELVVCTLKEKKSVFELVVCTLKRKKVYSSWLYVH